VNLSIISKYFSDNNLWDTPFRDFSKGDIERLAEVFAEASEGGFSPPYINPATQTLVIPHNAPLKYRWWQGGQTTMETLEEFNATEEVKRKYRHD